MICVLHVFIYLRLAFTLFPYVFIYLRSVCTLFPAARCSEWSALSDETWGTHSLRSWHWLTFWTYDASLSLGSWKLQEINLLCWVFFRSTARRFIWVKSNSYSARRFKCHIETLFKFHFNPLHQRHVRDTAYSSSRVTLPSFYTCVCFLYIYAQVWSLNSTEITLKL